MKKRHYMNKDNDEEGAGTPSSSSAKQTRDTKIRGTTTKNELVTVTENNL